MEKKTSCEFRDRCIKRHQDAGEKMRGKNPCGFIGAGTVLGCPKYRRFSDQAKKVIAEMEET